MCNKKVGIWLGIGIFLAPLIFSWFTLKKGYSKKAKLVSFGWLILIVTLAIADSKNAAPFLSISIVVGFFYLCYKFFSWLWTRANTRKTKILAIINDDEQWAAYCHKKNLTASMQKFVLSSYGIKKEPVITAKTEVIINNDISTEHESPGFDKSSFDDQLITLWAGDTKDVEFTYESFHGERLRRTVKPTEICFNNNGKFYLKGFCLTRNAPRTFKETNIKTKIKVGSKRYDFDEWCEEVLHIDMYSVWENYHTDCA